MSQKTLEEAFPKRPLINKGGLRLRALIFFLMFMGIGGGLGFVVAGFLPSLLIDQQLSNPENRAGTLAGEVEGECRARLFISLCTLRIDYTTEDGVRRQAESDLLFSGEIESSHESLDIFVLKDDPTQVGVTWGIERLSNRWMSFVIASGFLVLMIVAGFIIPVVMVRQSAGLVKALADPRPVAVQLLSEVKVRANKGFQTQDENGTQRLALKLRPKGDLFVLDKERAVYLALRGTEDTDYLVLENGYPVDLTPEELEALREAYRRAD